MELSLIIEDFQSKYADCFAIAGIFGGGNAAPWGDGVNGGNDNRIEHNRVSHVAFEAEDSGGFYTCGQDGTAMVNRGNVLAKNVFSFVAKDLTSLTTGGVYAIYFDDLMSGWTVVGNVIEDSEFGILLGGGRDTTIEHNVFRRLSEDLPLVNASKGRAIYIDDRGTGGDKALCSACNGSACGLNSNYAVVAAALRNPEWAKYNISLVDPCVPRGIRIVCNEYCECGAGLYGVGGTTCPSCALKIWGSTATNNFESDHC